MEGWQINRRSGYDDYIHDRLRAAICVPTKRCLWVPEDAITFIPALCDTIYGDGRALWNMATCNSRPAFYVIRGDSEWEERNWYSGPRTTFGEVLDYIYQDLEDQFGTARLDSEEDDPARIAEGFNQWPALDDENGCAWGQACWPKIFATMTEVACRDHGFRSHTILKREYAVEDQFARWAEDGGSSLESHFY